MQQSQVSQLRRTDIQIYVSRVLKAYVIQKTCPAAAPGYGDLSRKQFPTSFPFLWNMQEEVYQENQQRESLYGLIEHNKFAFT